MATWPRSSDTEAELRSLDARLAALGVVVSPTTVPPGAPVRKPLRTAGEARLSEAVVRGRREDDAEPKG
jgi:hypothetical protein